MRCGWRVALLGLAFAALLPALWHVALRLPGFGAPTAGYGPAVNALTPGLRHVSNMVAAVNFDFRTLDTLGEELMLLCAVTGAVVLLRGTRGEKSADTAGRVPGRASASRTDATVLACRVASPLVLLYGLYMALHGTVTPGGGFQGGVIMASGLLLLYLGEGYAVWRRLLPSPALQLLEGLGGAIFVAAGAVPMLASQPAFTNILPLGQFKDLYSGGLMLVVNGAVALAVAAGFGNLLLEFMEETREPQSDSVPDEEDE